MLPEVPYVKLPDQSLGVGDTIHRITLFLNIKKCAKCRIRHQWLNTHLPYFWRANKYIREIRNKLVKMDATIYPVVTDYSITEKYNPDDYAPCFSSIYPIE
jgi:hypothetical protein